MQLNPNLVADIAELVGRLYGYTTVPENLAIDRAIAFRFIDDEIDSID